MNPDYIIIIRKKKLNKKIHVYSLMQYFVSLMQYFVTVNGLTFLVLYNDNSKYDWINDPFINLKKKNQIDKWDLKLFHVLICR